MEEKVLRKMRGKREKEKEKKRNSSIPMLGSEFGEVGCGPYMEL